VRQPAELHTAPRRVARSRPVLLVTNSGDRWVAHSHTRTPPGGAATRARARSPPCRSRTAGSSRAVPPSSGASPWPASSLPGPCRISTGMRRIRHGPAPRRAPGSAVDWAGPPPPDRV